jgi:hypothetical protein
MMLGPGLSEIGKAAGAQRRRTRSRRGPAAYLRILREALQTARSIASGRGAKARPVRAALERADQRIDAARVGIAVAPVERSSGEKRCSSIASISSGGIRR